MLAWLFSPTCPCDVAAKTWVEQRLAWLAKEFHDSAFSGRRIVLPTHDFFPDPFDGTNKAVRLMLDRVCGYMDVDPYTVKLEFTDNANKLEFVNESGNRLPAGAAGTYQSIGDTTSNDQKYDRTNPFKGRRRAEYSLIRIDKSELNNPMGLVGTIAHELSHARLMGEGRIGSGAYDNELLTDLTTVHLGLGIFLANSPRNWDGQYTKWPKTDLLKPEYMTPPMFGWALAHLAWFRDEQKPSWARHLSSGAKANLYQGLRYLSKTGDTTYQPRNDSM